MATITAAVVDVLFLTQEVDTNIKVLAVEQVVGIADAVVQNMLPQQPRSLLFLGHSLTVNKTIGLSTSNTLILSETPISRAYDESISDLLFIWQDAIVVDKWPLVIQALTLEQSVDQFSAKSALSTLALTQEVSVNFTVTRNIAHSTGLVSEVSGYLPSRYWTAFDINVVEP